MSDATNGITLGWKFTYSMSEAIVCDKDIRDMEDVEFDTNVDHRLLKTITGFRIMVHVKDMSEARLEADRMALRLASLLVASSGTHSEHRREGYEEVKASGKRKVGKYLGFGYQGRDYPIVNVDPAVFRDILHSDLDFVERMLHIAKAWQASKVRDYHSVIKHLVLAYNEEPTGVWAKFKYLRHALSHTKDPLRQDTVNGLKQFGSNYFMLTGDGRFDFESASNLHYLEVQARRFLAYAHNCLQKELHHMVTSDD